MNDQDKMANYKTREWPDIENLYAFGPVSDNPIERFVWITSQIAPDIANATLETGVYRYRT